MRPGKKDNAPGINTAPKNIPFTAFTWPFTSFLRMRLSDAIKETAPQKGLQTHRSWWVAEAGVKRVKKQDGKLSITLKNDAIAPVSRNKAKIVREAGWV